MAERSVEKRKILVTGATGFIGSHLARRLVSDGHDVHALVRETSDPWRLGDSLDKVTLHVGDLTDLDSLKAIVEKVKPDGIYHLAMAPVISGVAAPDIELIKTNFIGAMNLIEAVSDIDYSFFINTGSILEYGVKTEPLNETDICEPKEAYGISKLGATLYAQSVTAQKDKPILTLRLFTPYGPYNQRKRLTHIVIINSLSGQDIRLTQPSVMRDYVYVDDIVEMYIEAMEKAQEYKGGVFNVGTGRQTSLGDIVGHITRKLGTENKVKWGAFPSVSYDSEMWQADMTKTFGAFKWRPKVKIFDGLDRTIESIKENEIDRYR